MINPRVLYHILDVKGSTIVLCCHGLHDLRHTLYTQSHYLQHVTNAEAHLCIIERPALAMRQKDL